jgi:hypothetical protein
VQAGYVRHFTPWKGVECGIGGNVSASIVPRGLESRYYGRVAPGFGAFVTVRPASAHR